MTETLKEKIRNIDNLGDLERLFWDKNARFINSEII